MSNDLAALIERVDLAALVERYAGPGRRSGATVSFCCPHPTHPDRSPSFTVSKNRNGRQVARCWSQCDWHGDALAFVQWIEQCSVREAADKLRGLLGESRAYDPVTRPKVAAKPKQQVQPTPTADTSRRPNADTAERLLTQYLSKRQWPREVAERYGLEVVTGRAGRPYIRHPFFTLNADSRPVVQTWQDRLCQDLEGVSRWDTPAGASLLLYNEPALSRTGVELVVICEGPADAISAEVALSKYANACAVAVAGAGGWKHDYNDRYRDKLAGKTVLVVGDRDSAGDTMRASVAVFLKRVAKRLRVLTPPPGTKDLTDWCQRDGFEKVGRVLVQLSGLTVNDPNDSPPPNGRPTSAGTGVALSYAEKCQQVFDWCTEAGLSPRWAQLALAA